MCGANIPDKVVDDRKIRKIDDLWRRQLVTLVSHFAPMGGK